MEIDWLENCAQMLSLTTVGWAVEIKLTIFVVDFVQ
jgi:hypothetical protein